MYLWSPYLQKRCNETTSWRGVAVRQGSPQRGGLTVKKGVVIGFTAKNIKTVLALLTEEGRIGCLVTGVRRHDSAKAAWKFLFLLAALIVEK